MTSPDIPLPAPGDTSWSDWAADEEAQSDAFRDGVSVDELSASGTPSSTTFLRGDGAWATPPTGSGGTTSAATTTAAGIVELATTAETTTGTDTVRAVTPAGMKAVADTKVSSSDIDNDVVLTQAAYDALATKDSRTRYNIVG